MTPCVITGLRSAKRTKYFAERMTASDIDDPLELYDELYMNGERPDPVAFAAKYPGTPDLLARIRRLDAVHDELDLAVSRPAARAWPKAIGGYTLGAMLGERGKGAVFEGVSAAGVKCAVKLMRSETQIALQRFEREAAIAKTLTGDGIARLLDFGIERGRAYLVSERIDGRTLKDLCAGPLPDAMEVARRVGWIWVAARAIAEAHAQGIVHRDLKPSNLMLDARGRVRVIDFGLAAQSDALALTRSGIFIGSHSYAAPEQLLGERRAIGPHTDVFGLAATLFELLTGEAPFRFPTFAARLEHATDKPKRTARELNPAVSAKLSKAIGKALLPQVKKRTPSAEEFAAAIK